LHLKPVLYNILQANGGNDLVEEKRGKKHANIKIEDIINGIQSKKILNSMPYSVMI